ncbi:MAG: glycosyltransferase family 2 protein [Planctomycetota bacterium]|nr:glycosyltransferase family 2 protein [Planctomycetota bacterium]
MEEDVIGATVANAFTQGCDRVYLVDNDSRDGTVREALLAGATLGAVFATEQYDEPLRLKIMNDVVADVSRRESSEHIWWLWLDADEFPHGPWGMTIRQYLAQLDRRFRIVGARFINHFPDRRPEYIPGFHPLDFQPLCEEHTMGCAKGHRKHSLQRFDRGGQPIVCDLGFHRANSVERPLREPTESIFLHHFPFRVREVTRRRLALLCGTDETGRTRVRDGDDAGDGMVPRFETLEAVYRGDWQHARNYRVSRSHSHSIPRPVPWPDLVGPEHSTFARWYAMNEVESVAREVFRPSRGAPSLEQDAGACSGDSDPVVETGNSHSEVAS